MLQLIAQKMLCIAQLFQWLQIANVTIDASINATRRREINKNSVWLHCTMFVYFDNAPKLKLICRRVMQQRAPSSQQAQTFTYFMSGCFSDYRLRLSFHGQQLFKQPQHEFIIGCAWGLKIDIMFMSFWFTLSSHNSFRNFQQPAHHFNSELEVILKDSGRALHFLPNKNVWNKEESLKFAHL